MFRGTGSQDLEAIALENTQLMHIHTSPAPVGSPVCVAKDRTVASFKLDFYFYIRFFNSGFN